MIKTVKPSRKSRYKQGYVDASKCKKLIGTQVIYRSSYELKFILWLENSKDVSAWGSEEIEIPYIMDGKTHRYYPDYFMVYKGSKYIIEVKPYNQTQPPKTNSLYALNEYKKNMLKWQAAKEFCLARGCHFIVITEKTLNKL